MIIKALNYFEKLDNELIEESKAKTELQRNEFKALDNVTKAMFEGAMVLLSVMILVNL